MNHSERNRELLKRIQQKAEALRETRDSNDQFETELEAVQEVYGLSDSEMKRITEESAWEVIQKISLNPTKWSLRETCFHWKPQYFYQVFLKKLFLDFEFRHTASAAHC